MRGPRDPKSPDVSSHFSLFGCLRGGSRQARDGDPNLSESVRLAVFGHVRSCILIAHRASRAILYDPRDLSLGCQCGCSLERADPGRRT